MDQRLGISTAPMKTKRRRGLAAPPPPATGQESPLPTTADDRVMLLLFETPSGFAIFNFCASLIEKPNALEKIWTHFILSGKAKNVVWLRQFQTFKDKSGAINQSTGINESLTEMIMTCHSPGQRMAVGKPEYIDIVEERLKITCVHDPTVMELMWGIQICMPSLVPEEKSPLTEDDRLPMSQGLKKILGRYDCDYVNPEMLDQQIIMTAYALFECDSLEAEKAEDLRFAASLVKVVSGIDTADWGLLKIATALKKIWCPEEAGNSCEMIPEVEVSRLVNDADKYKVKLEKDACLKLSREIVKAHDARTSKKELLKKFVERAKKAYEAQQPKFTAS